MFLNLRRSTLLLPSSLLVLMLVPACAQSVGIVRKVDATVVNTGPVVAQTGEMTGNTTTSTISLIGQNSLVVANDHTAPISLSRGGEIRLCQTTRLHISGSLDQSVLIAIDRGAVELRFKAKLNDTVMTPDLQFTFSDPGPVNLDMRVTSNGDTCVENRGHRAPTLKIADLFGQSSYELKAGQHVLFEHGSLREVVDKETTPCGCPPDDPNQRVGSLADAALASGNTSRKPTPARNAATANPFPAAESVGLAPPTPIPAEKPDSQPHVQVATSLTYDPNAPRLAPEAAQPTTPVQDAVQPTPLSIPAAKHTANPFSAIGHFFKRIFVR